MITYFYIGLILGIVICVVGYMLVIVVTQGNILSNNEMPNNLPYFKNKPKIPKENVCKPGSNISKTHYQKTIESAIMNGTEMPPKPLNIRPIDVYITYNK